MIERKIDKNHSKFSIVTLDSNIPKNHIYHDFMEKFNPLNISEPK